MRENAAGVLVAVLAGICFALVIALVIAIFYFLTLQKALSRVQPRNRLMEPGLVWLGLIPLFNIVWSFFIATRVPGSLRNEFQDQGRDDGSDYGRGIGLANAILGAVSAALQGIASVTQDAAIRGIFAPLGLASLVLFIIFWVKIAGYSGRLATGPRYDGRDDDYRDDHRDDYRGDYPDDRPDRGPQRPSDAIRPEDQGRYRN
jgi:hypothetical protein